ncbi:MAG: LOG family protein [Chloroflexota bacterium]
MTTIAVFGSGAVEPGSPDYLVAYDVGWSLARVGYVVMTGGYMGVMAAASEGAAAGNADCGISEADRVIGVTYGSQSRTLDGVNRWVQQEIRYPTHAERITHLIMEPEGYVVMPGGVGTRREFARVARCIKMRTIPPRPVIFIGSFWQAEVQQLLAEVGTPELRDLFVFVETAAESVAVLAQNIA